MLLHRPRNAKWLRLLAIGVASAFWTGAAWAEPPRSTLENRPDEPTSYTFEDEQVLGDTLNPNGQVLVVRRNGVRESLVRARENFVDRLLRSVEAL